jgi:valyl-tRNA synthetase
LVHRADEATAELGKSRAGAFGIRQCDGKPPAQSIALAAYPRPDESQIDTSAETEMAILQDLIAAVRNIRTELKVDRKQKLPIEIFADAEVRGWIERDRSAVELLAEVDSVRFVDASLAKVAGARSTSRFDVRVVYERKIDVAAERERLTKEVAKLSGELQRGTAQLSNEAFLAKAPANVVDGLNKRKLEVEVLLEKAKAALDELATVQQ